MMLEFKLNLEGFGPTIGKLERLERELITDKDVLTVAQGVHTRIITRTLGGKDVKGRRFKPYSPRYAKYRKDHGRPTGRVDLNFSGRMQAAISEKIVGPLKARILFRDTQQAAKAHGHNTGFLGRGPKREWFAVNDKDRDFAVSELKDAIDARIARLG